MLDIAIAGGGLTGLALARALEQKGFDYCLFEARDRVGGRILSRQCRLPNISVDLGPTWYWPDTQPAMVQVVSELGLTSFPQYDDGTVWVLTDPDQEPRKLGNETLHAGALRIAGGMARITEAIVAELPPIRVAVSNVLTSVQDMRSHVEMVYSTCRGEIRRAARQVVLAMPPRLIEEHIRFIPALPDKVQRALLARPTWMAQQAKAVVVYGSDVYGSTADFRARVGSGNALVHHEQAVLGEVFDATSMDRGVVALGGFLALPPRVRARFAEGLEMLIASQFVQLFGPTVEAGVMHYQDWATEPFTCASLDRREDATPTHPHAGDPCLRAEFWGGRLRFAGSEFATEQAGYLEGALIDAARVATQLTEAEPAHFVEVGNLEESRLGINL